MISFAIVILLLPQTCQDAYKSGKPGDHLREFINSGKLRENSGN